MTIKIIVLIVSAILYCWGGYSNHNARRFMLPVLLAVSMFWLTKCWWAFTSLTVIGVFCTGYGEKSIFEHIFNDAWARFVWFMLASLCISLWAIYNGYLAWYWFVAYIVINPVLGISLRKINQIIGDLVFGLGFASILFLLK